MVEHVIQTSWQTLQAIKPSLLDRNDLALEITQANDAQARGYYLPDEDENLRTTYQQYLHVRSSLWQMIHELRPHLKDKEQNHTIFALGFCAVSMLTRSASFLIDLAKDRPVIWEKLDEAEPRYHLPRKNFTKIYRSLSNPAWMWRYHQAKKHYEKNRNKIHQSLEMNDMAEMVTWLTEEEPHFITQKRTHWKNHLDYRRHSLLRRTSSGYTKIMFHLFRLGGSTIAELKQPFIKPLGSGKRVTPEILTAAQPHLQAGDILITRHDDAMSNLFLPGYWPHAALYLGTEAERNALKLPPLPDPGHTILEAKKDGVKLRHLTETLNVDAFVVLRPQITPDEMTQALTRALTHAGKLYDFLFNFEKSDRLACTEVIYRTYHGIGPCQLELKKAGHRLVLSAEELIHQGLEKNLLTCPLIFGAHDNILTTTPNAQSILIETLKT